MKNQIDIDSILERLLSVRGNKPGKTVDLKEEEIKFLIDKTMVIFFYLCVYNLIF